jgi:NhaA family Na+:H+ antiporter
VPPALKIFLTALAIIDDLGAIMVIAIFYTDSVSALNLLIALGIFAGLFIMGKMGVKNLVFYIIPGVAMWYFMFQSGVHATISGVLLAFTIPFDDGNENSPSYKLQHFLHKPVAFIIIPLFALANTGIRLQPGFYSQLLSKNSLGIITGLVLGKPLGIIAFAWIAVKTKLSSLPGIVTWRHIAGAGLLAGIGFTMSIFITLLAFDDEATVINSKIAILFASLTAAVIGLVILKKTKPVIE